MSKVCYFELQADDFRRAMTFYENAFGWKFAADGENYWMFDAGPKDEEGVNGGLMRRAFPGQGILVTIAVDDVDQAVERIVAAGGEIIHPKDSIPGIGWYAYFKDSEGNAAGVFQRDSSAK